MFYVIFNIQTEKLFKKPRSYGSATYFEKERGAKMVCTRMKRD